MCLYNTMTRQKEPFETIEPGKVRMYVCGVTPYASAHVGHAMSGIVFDVIRRYLEHSGYEVRHATNFTDIDDRIIASANREGIDPSELTEELIADWHRETEALGILRATLYPRATQEIPAIIETIQGLIERGFAYSIDGDVYYRVREFAEYGKLSHRDLDELLSGARIEVDARKEDPLDFALWKAAKPGEPSWPSPWSAGRPGWHIECSAMVSNHLDSVIDIHGGGADLIFPHHENEIAQSEAYLGCKPFARYWVHNGLLQVGTDKMSKSIGNIVPTKELVDRGLGQAFRLLVLQSHYRAPLTYTEEGLEAAARGLDRLHAATKPGGAIAASNSSRSGEYLAAFADETDRRFHEAMDDDCDTPVAVAALFDLARAINRAKAEDGDPGTTELAQSRLIALAGVLGLDLVGREDQDGGAAAPFIDLLLDVRNHLRDAKQWALADQIRDGLSKRGITIEDTSSGTTWRRADRYH
ncbi:MAG: cysteine--tRNA ligase [Thermomicrobiales bacterium]